MKWTFLWSFYSLICFWCVFDHFVLVTILVWFNTRKKATFPLSNSSQLWQLSLWSNVCCLLQHGGLRGAKGNMWNHLPEIPPVCVQLYVLGESLLCGVWVLLQQLQSSNVLSASGETWGRRPRGQAVMTAWSVSKHRWRRKKMRRNHLIFKQSKIGIIGWSLLLFWLVELQQSYTAKHSKAKSSELSSNEDAVFWECTTTNNCHIWMRRIKLLQTRHDSECEITHLEIALCPYVIIICLPDNLMFETGKCCWVSAVPNTGVITMWIFYYWMDSDFPHALMPLYGKCLLGFSSEHFGATYEIILSYQKKHMPDI